MLDWKPRGRDAVIGNIPWLPRITDKARAYLAGRLADYIYPCPADKAFLAKHNISPDEFTLLVKENPSDDQMIERVREIIAKNAK